MEFNFGKFLKTIRIDRGLTQAKLASMCGVTQSTIGVWENGVNIPSVENLYALATALDIPPSNLRLGIAGEPIVINEMPAKPLVIEARPSASDYLKDPAGHDIGEIKNILESQSLTFGWNVEIKGRSGKRWEADIVAEDFIVNFKSAINASSVKSAILNMVAMKTDTKDDRFYSLIVLIPENWDGHLSKTIAQKQLQALAGIVGVTLEFSTTPKEAADIVVAFCRFSGKVQERDFYDESLE